MPDFQINYLALLAALVAKAIFGSLWYGPLFGRAWNRELGNAPGFRPQGGLLFRARTLRYIGMALTVYVLAVAIGILRPSAWGVGADGPSSTYGFLAALFIWVGFYVPQMLSRVAWEGASWRLLRIHALYHLVTLQMAGQIIAHWH